MTRCKASFQILAISFLVLAVSSVTACATWGSLETESTEALPRLVATVENNNRRDIVVHAFADGIEWRLGAVLSGQERTFPLPGRILTADRYYLIADPIGEWDRVLSEPITPSSIFRPHFAVGQDSNTSMVRFPRAPTRWVGVGR